MSRPKLIKILQNMSISSFGMALINTGIRNRMSQKEMANSVAEVKQQITTIQANRMAEEIS